MTLKVFSTVTGRQQITGKKDEKQIKKKLLKGFLLGTLTVCVLGMCAGCGQKKENIENTVTSPTAQEQTGKTGQKSLSWSELTQTGSMDLSYADQFSVTYYGEENYALVIIGEDEKFLVVPEGEPVRKISRKILRPFCSL